MRIPFYLCVVLALLGLSCSTVPIQEQGVFMPKPSVTPASFEREGVTLEDIYFISVDSATTDNSTPDSVRLNAWYLSQPDAQGTVIFFGGNGFYLVQSLGYIEALTGHPVNVFMWDYRGYGNSEGQPSVAALKQDALAAYDHLIDTYDANPDRLIAHGHSLGTFMAMYLEEQRDVAGVVLENPATNVEEWVDHLAPWFLRLFINFEVDESLRGESNLERVQSMTEPLLIIGGAEDFITAPEMARTLYEEAGTQQKDLVIIEGGGHNELYEANAYQTAYEALLDAAFSADPPSM